MKKNVLVLMIFFLTGSSEIFSLNTDDFFEERVKGVAAFLVDRANSNYLYVFEQELANNKAFSKYFPKTYKLASSNNLQVLLTSNELWETTIKSDINSIIKESLIDYIQLIRANISQFGTVDKISEFLSLAVGTKIVIDGKEYPINSIPIGADEIIREKINSIYYPYSKLLDAKDKMDALINNTIDSTNSIDDVKTSILEAKDLLLSIGNEYQSLLGILDTEKGSLTNTEILEKFFEYKKIIDDQKEIFNNFYKIYSEVGFEQMEQYSNTYKVIKILDFIEAIQRNFIKSELTSQGYKKLRRYVIFFAQIADAQSEEEVQLILSQATLPAVSFKIKRENKFHVLINSYVGYTVTPALENGISALIGLELSYGVGDIFSLSFFLAPLDFSNPVNQYMWDKTETINYEEIFTATCGISFGLENLPIAVGALYKLNEMNNGYKSLSLFVDFDLPLFTIY